MEPTVKTLTSAFPIRARMGELVMTIYYSSHAGVLLALVEISAILVNTEI